MPTNKILWIEDDYMEPLEYALKSLGHEVTRAFFLSDAVDKLNTECYDLVLLDVMIPLEKDDIDMGFTYYNTDGGDNSGVIFYERYCSKLSESNTQVLVYTIRGSDKELRNRFRKAGLPSKNFIDKVKVTKINDIIFFIERTLNQKEKKNDKLNKKFKKKDKSC